MDDSPEDLTQYRPSWQDSPQYATAPPIPPTVPNTPPMEPATGVEQPVYDLDPASAMAMAPPPAQPPGPISPAPSTIPNIIIVFNGTAYYTTLDGVTTGPV
jgi:hypothetical protein